MTEQPALFPDPREVARARKRAARIRGRLRRATDRVLRRRQVSDEQAQRLRDATRPDPETAPEQEEQP